MGFSLFLVLGLQVGRTVANLIAGNGLEFAAREDLFTSIGGLVEGDAAAGLPGLGHPASTTLLWSCIAVVDVMVFIGGGWATKWVIDRWGPGRLQGMATPSQAEALLGVSRLRRQAKVIRPDLYGGRREQRR